MRSAPAIEAGLLDEEIADSEFLQLHGLVNLEIRYGLSDCNNSEHTLHGVDLACICCAVGSHRH